jgi:uncharacterized protein (TIGR01655 family)
MKKKPIFWIIIVIAVVFVVAVALWGKQYYEDRYVGSDYYTMVPLDFDITPETMFSMSGEDVGLGKTYRLTAYNEQGESKEVVFSVSVERGNFPQPGTFLHVSASKQIVVGWNVIDESEMPENILILLT